MTTAEVSAEYTTDIDGQNVIVHHHHQAGEFYRQIQYVDDADVVNIGGADVAIEIIPNADHQQQQQQHHYDGHFYKVNSNGDGDGGMVAVDPRSFDPYKSSVQYTSLDTMQQQQQQQQHDGNSSYLVDAADGASYAIAAEESTLTQNEKDRILLESTMSPLCKFYLFTYYGGSVPAAFCRQSL